MNPVEKNIKKLRLVEKLAAIGSNVGVTNVSASSGATGKAAPPPPPIGQSIGGASGGGMSGGGSSAYGGDQLKVLKDLAGRFPNRSNAQHPDAAAYKGEWQKLQKQWGMDTNPMNFAKTNIGGNKNMVAMLSGVSGGQNILKGLGLKATNIPGITDVAANLAKGKPPAKPKVAPGTPPTDAASKIQPVGAAAIAAAKLKKTTTPGGVPSVKPVTEPVKPAVKPAVVPAVAATRPRGLAGMVAAAGNPQGNVAKPKAIMGVPQPNGPPQVLKGTGNQ